MEHQTVLSAPNRVTDRCGIGSTVWCSNRDMPSGPLELRYYFGVPRYIPILRIERAMPHVHKENENQDQDQDYID